MAESFDAVLAEMRANSRFENGRWVHVAATGPELERWADRLAAAHAAEVAERDAEITRIHALHNSVRSRLDEVQAAYLDYRARAEAAERDARELRGLLREARDYVQIAANEEAAMNECKVEAAHRTSEARFLASIDRVVATTEQAAGGLVRDGGE